MDKRIGIILTSIERPQALKKSVESIISQWQEEWVLFVGIQDDYDSQSFSIMRKIVDDNPNKIIRIYDLEYDCGISMARNELIQKVNLWGIPYTLLTADNIIFDESMKSIEQVIQGMKWNQFDLCGLDLNNRIRWEAYLNLIEKQSFELDFIKFESIPFIKCDITRNFWLAKTEALVQVPYDEQLIMCEHEDFFWRVKQQGFVVGCTNLCSGTYNKGENTPEYDKIRATNFRIGQQRLKDKYSLKGWVTYKNLERTQL
jgi:hypothetical protein